ACSGTGGVDLLNSTAAMPASTPASTSRIPVVISNAAQGGTTVANPAAIAAKRKPSMNTANNAAPRPNPIPAPKLAAFFFSSRAASSSSSRAREIACSATCFAAGPTPVLGSVLWVCMSPPVDHFCDHDAGHERCARDHERVQALAVAGSLALRPSPGRRNLRRVRGLRLRLPVGCPHDRVAALGAGFDQAGLQLSSESRAAARLARALPRKAAFRSRLAGGVLELGRAASPQPVPLALFFPGGAPPVARRQIGEAPRLATRAEPAARPA